MLGRVKDGQKDLNTDAWDTDGSKESNKKEGRWIQSWEKMTGFILGTLNESKICKFAMLKKRAFNEYEKVKL